MPLSGISGVLCEPSPVCICRKNDQVPEDCGRMRETLDKSYDIARAGLALTAVMITTSGALAAPQPLIISALTSTAPANCWIDGPGRVEDSPIRVCHGKA